MHGCPCFHRRAPYCIYMIIGRPILYTIENRKMGYNWNPKSVPPVTARQIEIKDTMVWLQLYECFLVLLMAHCYPCLFGNFVLFNLYCPHQSSYMVRKAVVSHLTTEELLLQLVAALLTASGDLFSRYQELMEECTNVAFTLHSVAADQANFAKLTSGCSGSHQLLW